MKEIRTLRILVSALLVVGMIGYGGCGSEEDGACTWGSGIGSRCFLEVHTAGQCDMMNGTWHPAETCASLGYEG